MQENLSPSWVKKIDTEEETKNKLIDSLKEKNEVGSSVKKKKVPSYKVMERFPIVTYYSGVKERWLTPYVDNVEDLVTYARYNDVDYLIVDTMDFEKYRPKLLFLLDEKKQHHWLIEEHTIAIPWEKVILYKIEK